MVLSVAFARENRDKYKREGHEVKYVELKGVCHMWGTKAGVNETIWKFFADRPLRRKL
jgi:polyhydroxybutyrate depolymerase